MANKQLTFSAKLDDKEFLDALKKIQGKVKELYSPSSNNYAFQAAQDRMRKMGILGPSKEDEERSKRFNDLQKRSQNELTQIIQEQYGVYQKISKEINQKIERIDSLRKKEGELTEGSKEQLKVKEKIKKIEDETLKIAEEQGKANEKLGETLDALETKQSNFNNKIKAGVSAIGFMAAAFQKFNQLNYQEVEFRRNVRRATGTLATEGPGGEILSSMYQGKMSDYFYYQTERQKALRMTMEGLGAKEKMYSPANILAGAVAAGTAGATAGRFLGAGVGSLLGGVGALPGAGIGTALGAAVGSAGYMLSDMRNIKALTDPEGLRKQLLAEAAREQLENIEIEKRQNPLKVLAREEYQRTGQENLQMQRMLGLSDESFYGVRGIAGSGFLGRGLSRGYTREELLGASQGILGAGGSTRSAIDNAQMVAQMQRAGVQNAAGIMGTLSRTMGTAETTQSATVRIMAEGVKQGLDKSEYRQENNRFMEILGRAVSLSGAITEKGAGAVTAYAGQFLSGKSMAEIEAVPTAMEFVKRLQTSAGTPESVIKASKIMASEDFGSLPMMMKEELAYGDPAELSDPTNPKVISMAAKAKMSPEAFVKAYQKINKESVISTRPIQQLSDIVSKKRQELIQGGKTSEEAMGILQTSGEYGELEIGLGHEKGAAWRNMSREQKKSVISYLTSPETEGMSIDQAIEKAKTGLAAKPGEQKLGQADLEGLAKQQSIVNDQFKEMKTGMESAAEATKKLTKEMVESALLMEDAIKKLQSGDSRGFWEKMIDSMRGDTSYNWGGSTAGTDSFKNLWQGKATAGSPGKK